MNTKHGAAAPPGSGAGAKAPRWAWAVGTGLGSGWLRPGPGTWGTLAGLIAWCLLSRILLTPFVAWAGLHQNLPRFGYLMYGVELMIFLAILALTWLAVRSADLIVRETGDPDPGYAVIDEWAGVWVTLWPMRWEIAARLGRLAGPGWWRWLPALLVPFLVFRILDIWKPWPVRQIQVLPGGSGVVADDLVAGLYGIPVVMLAAPLVLHMLA